MKASLLIFLSFALTMVAQTQPSPSEQVADKIARKLKDSLSLSEEQRRQIYEINLQLADQKAQARVQYAPADSIGRKLQQVENSRDALYRSVLTKEQYQSYRRKKRFLVNNN